MVFCVRKFKMESSKKCVYTKPRQYEVMVEFMTKHSDLAKGLLNTPNAKSTSRELWQRLCQDLNAAGPPTHEVEKWKKVWADFKQHIKVKSRRNKQSLSGTGGGPSKYCSLTSLEQQIAELLAINDYVDGKTGTLRFGANMKASSSTVTSVTENDIEILTNVIQEDTNTSYDDDMENLNKQSSRDLNCPSPYKKVRRISSNKETLLKKQVENQIKYQEESLELLSKSDENQKCILKELKELNQNIATKNKYLKRNSDLKERCYKLEKEKFEFLKKHEIEKTKRKISELELKQKKFELECKKKKGLS